MEGEGGRGRRSGRQVRHVSKSVERERGGRRKCPPTIWGSHNLQRV